MLLLKYLNKYKIFESNKEDFDNDFLSDIFLEISDNSLLFEIDKGSRGDNDYIAVRLHKDPKEFTTIRGEVFNIGKVKDSVMSCISYLSEFGYELEYIHMFGGELNPFVTKNTYSLDEFIKASKLKVITNLSIIFIPPNN